MAYIHVTDDAYRPADSSGNPIAPTGMSLSFGLYGSGTAYFSYDVNFDDYANPKARASVIILSDDLNSDPDAEPGHGRTDIDIRATIEISNNNFSTIAYSNTYERYAADSSWRVNSWGYYSRENISKNSVISKVYGNLLYWNNVSLPFSNCEYKVRFRNLQYRLHRSSTVGNWTSLTNSTKVYTSYAPFVLPITKPTQFVLNGLNTFDAVIESQFEYHYSYSITGSHWVFEPVRNEYYPYVVSGERTEHVYWVCYNARGNNAAGVATGNTYTLTINLDIQDPSDSNFKIRVCSTSASGDCYYQQTDDISMVSGSVSFADLSGSYDRYGYLLRNTDSVIRATANVVARYGAYATLTYAPFGASSSSRDVIYYTGQETLTRQIDQNIPDVGTSIATYVRVRIGNNNEVGRIASEGSFSANVLDYFVPSFPNLAVHRCDEDGMSNDNGDHCRIEWSVNIMPIANHNSKILTIVNPEGTASYNPLDSYTQSGVLIVAASTESSYNIIFTVTDDFNSITRTLVLSSAGVVMDWLYGGKGVAFGKVASKKLAVEVSEMWKLICYNLVFSGTDMTVWMKEVLARLKGIEQFASNIGSTSQYQVTFYDDSKILDRQWIRSGQDATDPGITPEREPTETTTYSFVGWALTNGATSANPNALINITSYRSIYAAFTSATRYYSVFFWNGGTLLQTVQDVQYHGTGTYSGSTPTSEDGTFVGFSPTGKYIGDNTSCYAVFYDDTEITDSWEQIIKACDDGSYATKYKVGQYKMLDLGAQGTIKMRCKGFKKDRAANGNKLVPMTWISDTLLATNKRFNPTRTSRYEDVPVESWTVTSLSDSYSYFYQSNNRGINTVAYGKFLVHFHPDSGSSGYYWRIDSWRNYMQDGDTLVIKANGTTIATWTKSSAPTYKFDRVTVDTDYEIEMIYTCATDKTASDSNYINFRFFASYLETGGVITSVDVEENRETTAKTLLYDKGTGVVGGWKESEYRAYLQNDIKALLPTEVRNGIKKVRKYSCSVDERLQMVANEETDDDIWAPSKAEADGYYNQETIGPEYAENSNTRVKRKGTTATAYRLRSIYSTSYPYYMSTSGSLTSGSPTNNVGVCIGFCT